MRREPARTVGTSPLPAADAVSPVERRRRAYFHRRLGAWFRRAGRHDLPWQRDRRGYAVWVSEIMLQQTTVETVRGYYGGFLRRFPTVRALAEANLDEVLALWSGLGYYRRAHHLHRAARLVVARHGGRLPRREEDLGALPGIGPSTAGAIASLAYDRPAVVLDTNVRRVLTRYWRDMHRHLGGGERALWALARWLLPEEGGRAHTQALMDLGALVCRPRDPGCPRCPLVADCPGPSGEGAPRRPKADSERRRRRMTLLLFRDRQGRVLLERRSSRGIWAGLWCLPEAEGSASVSVGSAGPGLLARRLHRLSHLDLEICLLAAHPLPPPGRSGRGRRWASARERARLGLPPIVRAMLESLPVT